MKTTDHHTGYAEQFLQVIVIVIFFSGFFVAGGTLLVLSRIYDFGEHWWQEFRPEKEGDNY